MTKVSIHIRGQHETNIVSAVRKRRTRHVRRGFSLVELLIALAITAALLTATLVSLNASFTAYQKTTEVASTHTISRLVMHRMTTLIKSGRDFGPFPENPLTTTVESNYIEFYNIDDQLMRLEWDPDAEVLYIVNIDGGGNETYNLLLEGVTQADGAGGTITPFTLEFEKGTRLYRASIDLTVVPDDNMDLDIEGDNVDELRLIASAMPRSQAFD